MKIEICFLYKGVSYSRKPAVHLDTKVYCHIIKATDPATIRSLCSFQAGLLLSDESKFSLYKITSDFSGSLFAGTETQVSLDGPVSSCQFKQPRGICTEFDHLVYRV